MTLHALLVQRVGDVLAGAEPALAAPVAVAAYDLTPGRAWTLVAAVPVTLGVVLGVIAVVRSRRRRQRAVARRAGLAWAAIVSGLVGAGIGAVVIAAAEGGPGTGSGIVGGYVAVVGGVVGAALGAVALVRARRGTLEGAR